MNLAEALATNNAALIKTALFALLHTLPSLESARVLDEEYNALKTPTEQKRFISQFASTDKTTAPQRDPKLLQQWTHYRWVVLELINMVNKHVYVQDFLQHKDQAIARDSKTPTENSPENYLNTISDAIKEHKSTGASIEESIATLQKVTLQIINTEHPTDPLSQPARNTLTHLANALTLHPANEDEIKRLLHHLLTKDAVPHARRTPLTEVHRTIELSLRPLYNNVPRFVQAIEQAYALHYGQALFVKHRKTILQAITLRDGYWPGLDADGNTSITDLISGISMVTYRCEAALQHISALDAILAHIPMLEASSQQAVTCSALIEAIQQFRTLLLTYKANIEQDPDDLYIDQGRTKIPFFEFALQQYQALLATHQAFLEAHPSLHDQTLYFEVQLRSYRLSFGVGHIRQDSSVFKKVWGTLFGELLADSNLTKNLLLHPFRHRHTVITEEEWIPFHQSLQETSPDSKQILHAILNLHHGKKYRTNPIDHPAIALVDSELNRLHLAKKNADLIENIIISNTQGAGDYLRVLNLLAIFPETPHQIVPSVVPLLETRDDLIKYRTIITAIIKPKLEHTLESVWDTAPESIQPRLKRVFSSKASIRSAIQSQSPNELRAFFSQLTSDLQTYLQPFLEKLVIEVMLGFSDTQRVSGIGASITIQETKENIIQFVMDCGMTPKLFHGPGQDLNRGGERLDEKATRQGKGREAFNTPDSTQVFRENLFAAVYREKAGITRRMEITSLPKKMRHWLDTFVQSSTSWYEALQNADGMGKPLGAWLAHDGFGVAMFNSTSRNTQRGVAESTGDRTAAVQAGGVRPPRYVEVDTLRAISSMFMQQLNLSNLNFLSPSVGMQAIGVDASAQLHKNIETFRVMVLKETIGTVMQNLSLSASMFDDYPELSPLTQDSATLASWAKDCQQGFPELLADEKDDLEHLDFKKFCGSAHNRYTLLAMLSRLFAHVLIESQKTVAFLATLHDKLHPNAEKGVIGLLAHHPHCLAQIQELVHAANPLFLLYSQHCQQIAHGHCLDQQYHGLNESEAIPDEVLSGVGKLLGDEVAGMMAAWVIPPEYTKIVHDDSKNRHTPAFFRAKREAAAIGRSFNELPRKGKPTIQFFDDESDAVLSPEHTQERLDALERVVEELHVNPGKR